MREREGGGVAILSQRADMKEAGIYTGDCKGIEQFKTVQQLQPMNTRVSQIL